VGEKRARERVSERGRRDVSGKGKQEENVCTSRLYASNVTITKLWLATTNKALKVLRAFKTMKGENERQLKTTSLYTIS